MKKIIDTHSHLNISPLIENSDYLIARYEELNIFANVVGTNIADSYKAIQLCKKSKNLFCTIGIHPTEKQDLNIDSINELELMIKNNLDQISCIGETGLDYFHDGYDKQEQIKYFKLQIELAIKYNKPLMLHIRSAHDDAIEILKQYKKIPITIIHCFSDGNEKQIKEYNDLNCYISIPGIVTFKNADKLRQLIPLIPINKLLTETDAPFLTPAPFRSKTNNSQYLIHTNNKVAEILDINIDELNEILLNNAKNIFIFL